MSVLGDWDKIVKSDEAKLDCATMTNVKGKELKVIKKSAAEKFHQLKIIHFNKLL